MDTERIFTDIYVNNVWGDPESRSGPGSSVFRTRLVRPALSQLFADLAVRSALDVPCGDFNWMRLTDMPGILYTGADVVPEIIHRNRQLYANEQRRFVCLNMISDPLPSPTRRPVRHVAPNPSWPHTQYSASFTIGPGAMMTFNLLNI